MPRNIVVLGTGQILNLLASMVMAVMLPKYIGDVGLGRLSFAIAVMTICGLLVRFGTETFLTKQVAIRPTAVADYVVNALALRIPLSLITTLVVVAAVNLGGLDRVTKELVYLALVAMMLESTASVLSAALQGLELMSPVARVLAISKIVQAAVVAALLLQGYGVLEVAAALSLSGFLGLLLWGIYFVRRWHFQARLHWYRLKEILRGGIPFLVWQASLFIYGQTDIILLSFFTRDAVVGWYSASYRLVNIATVVPLIIASASLPALSSIAAADPDRLKALANQATRLVMVATIPTALGIVVTVERVIGFLGFPQEFSHSVPIAIIVALSIPFVSIDMIIGNALIATNRQLGWAKISTAAAVINVCMNCAFIPISVHFYDNGGIGAASATFLTELFVMVLGIKLLGGHEVVLDNENLEFGVKCLIAAELMAVVVLLLGSINLPTVIAIGILIYICGLLALQAANLRELKHLVRNILLRRDREVSKA